MSGPGTIKSLAEPPDKGDQRPINILQENIIHIDDDDMQIETNNHVKSPTTNKENETVQKMSTVNPQANAETFQSKYIDVNNRYNSNSTGPFVVYVEHLSLNVGRLHPMKLAEKLLNIGDDERDITEINIIGRNRVKIVVSNATTANRLVKNTVFAENELIAYIPLHLTEKRGVIRGVDTSYSENELLEIIKSPIPIKNVRRLYKTVYKDDQKIRVARQMIVVTFNKVDLPQYIFINKIRFEVNCFYSPVVICYKCLRFGHTTKLCRSVKKCQICGKVTNENIENNFEKCSEDCFRYCLHCKSENHNSTDKNCPQFQKQKRIKECMAHLNISFLEAQKVVDNPSYASLVTKNKFSPLASLEEYPELPKKGNSSNQSKQITSRREYYATQPLPSTSSNSENVKKRKISDRSPNYSPIQREYPWTFGTKAIIDKNGPAEANFETIKYKIMSELSNHIAEYCYSLSYSQESKGEVIENIGKSIIDFFSTIFKDFQVHGQS